MNPWTAIKGYVEDLLSKATRKISELAGDALASVKGVLSNVLAYLETLVKDITSSLIDQISLVNCVCRHT